MYAKAHAILDDETIKPTGDKLLALINRFYGPKGLPNIFTQQRFLFSEDLIPQWCALVYIE